jgi:hypothetical protein
MEPNSQFFGPRIYNKLLSHQRHIALYLASYFGTHCVVRFYGAVSGGNRRGRSHTERFRSTLRDYLHESGDTYGFLLDNLQLYNVVYCRRNRRACYAGFYIDISEITFDRHRVAIEEYIAEVGRRGRLPPVTDNQWDFDGLAIRPTFPSSMNGETDSNRYEVHLSFTCVVKLYARIMQHPEKFERDIQVKSMIDVIQLLVNPECQHVTLEKYFENPDVSKSYTPCENKCMWCTKGIPAMTGRIYREKLSSLLVLFCSRGKLEAPSSLVKYIKDNKHSIYHESDVPGRSMASIHSLCIQLVATGILELRISDTNKKNLGKTDLAYDSVVIGLGKTEDQVNIMIDPFWDTLNTVTT